MALPLVAGAARALGVKAAPKLKGLVGGSARSHINYFKDKYSRHLIEKGKPKPNLLDKMMGKQSEAKDLTDKEAKNFDLEKGDAAKKLKEANDGENKDTPKGVSKQFKSVGNPFKALGKLKTVGGIAILLFLILFIKFAIEKVNDSEDGTPMTRLTLLWSTILGRTSISEQTNTTDGSAEMTVLSGDSPPDIQTLMNPLNWLQDYQGLGINANEFSTGGIS